MKGHSANIVVEELIDQFQFVGQSHGTTNYVILSKRSASKNLRTYGLSARRSVRRSFDSLRSLRMTMGGFVQDFSECEILGTACVPFPFLLLQEQPARQRLSLPLGGSCRASARLKRNAGENPTFWYLYQAYSALQISPFLFRPALRRATFPPGEGTRLRRYDRR